MAWGLKLHDFKFNVSIGSRHMPFFLNNLHMSYNSVDTTSITHESITRIPHCIPTYVKFQNRKIVQTNLSDYPVSTLWFPFLMSFVKIWNATCSWILEMHHFVFLDAMRKKAHSFFGQIWTADGMRCRWLLHFFRYKSQISPSKHMLDSCRK